ncbi:MAG: four-helix bundle copper-binding protein [Armatimonadota bacterium]
MPHVSPEMRECIDACTSCHQTCVETVTHCLQMGGKHAEADHIRLMLDCAEICETSANFMLRGSDLHQETCRTCAVVCERCAEDCERFDEDFMQRCAEECRNCAEHCRRMAGSQRTMARAA